MFEVLTAHGADAARWQGLAGRLPWDLRDIHFTPAYARVQEKLRTGAAFCAVYEWEDWFVMQPFLLRKVPGSGTHYDMTSLYGYGGPVSNMRGNTAAQLMGGMEKPFAEWRAAQRVVAEFCVLHPMAAESQLALMHGITEPAALKPVVLVNADQTPEAMIAEWRSDRRQNLKHAQATMHAVDCEPWQFMRLYEQTMSRTMAAPRWKMPQEYFMAHWQELMPDRGAFVSVTNGKTQSASIILFGGRTAYYHFTGNADDIERGANELLILSAAQLARRAGCQWLHLGGGVSSDPHDTLLAFKAGFSPHRRTVSTYRRVFDQEAYAALCEAAGRDPVETAYFPAYRAAEAT